MIYRMLLPLVGSLLLLSTGILAQQSEEVIRFNFRFGFFEDEWTPDSDIVKDDVEGVLCQTQYFMSKLLQNATNTKSVHAKATEISWGFYEGQDLPAHINFTIEFTDSAVQGDVNWVDDRILITEMENLGTPGLQRYITDWVWNAEPVDYNFFANANRMAFDGVKTAPVRGQMEEAECPETEAPTIVPTISPSPTLAPTTEAEYADSLLNGNGNGNATRPPDGAGGGGNPNDAGDGSNPDGEVGPDGQIYQNGADGPDGESPVGPGGELSRANWPFGPNYNDLSDLDPMADISLNFAMFEDHENPPSAAEVNALICQVNEFFTAELRRKLSDGTVHMKAVFVDWYFDEGGAGTAQEDIKVNLTAFAYYGEDEHDQVPAQDVFEVMKLTEAELKDFVENYVWKSEPLQENVFYHTESLSLNADMGTQPDTEAMLIEADGCVLPLNDDGSPFGGVYGPSGPDGQQFSNGAGSNPGGSGGANNPTVDPESLGFEGDAKQTRITINFRVSNLENIKEENAVKASGLDSSFPVFTNELVNELTARDAARRFLGQGRRNLRVVVVPESSSVDDVTEYPCPDSALPGLTCHSARAKYDVLMSSDEDPLRVNPDYTAASETAANDGTYNNVLQRVDPDTPLYIGIMTSTDQIPPGSRKRGYDGEDDDDDDSWFKWWYILLLLLLLLLCCLCCLFCWMSSQKNESQQKTTQERDVLVEEFEDEDAPNHGAPGDGDDEEEFVDDGGGVMVAYDPNAQPPPGSGQMVAYDPNKANKDAAERERILNESSQRGSKKKDDDDQVWEED